MNLLRYQVFSHVSHSTKLLCPSTTTWIGAVQVQAPYTFRNEDSYPAPHLGGDLAVYRVLSGGELDGVFTDFFADVSTIPPDRDSRDGQP
jgi:hypothetical protein